MLVGIKEILVINIKEDQESFKCLLKDGQNFEIKINYQIQERLNSSFYDKKIFIGNNPSIEYEGYCLPN